MPKRNYDSLNPIIPDSQQELKFVRDFLKQYHEDDETDDELDDIFLEEHKKYVKRSKEIHIIITEIINKIKGNNNIEEKELDEYIGNILKKINYNTSKKLEIELAKNTIKYITNDSFYKFMQKNFPDKLDNLKVKLEEIKNDEKAGKKQTKKKKKKQKNKQKGGFNFTGKLSRLFNPIGTIIKTQIAFQNLDKIIKKDNRELNKKIKEIENDFNRMPCSSFKKKYRKECYARKRKEKTKKRKH